MIDEQIRNIWAEYYPGWRTIRQADTICRLLCETILWRARERLLGGPDSAKVKIICAAIGIPLGQYWEVAKSGENQI